MTNLMLIATIARLLIVNARFAWAQAAVPVSGGGHASEDTASRPSRSMTPIARFVSPTSSSASKVVGL